MKLLILFNTLIAFFVVIVAILLFQSAFVLSQVINTATMPAGTSGCLTSIIDNINGFMYCGDSSAPPKVCRMWLSNFSFDPTCITSSGGSGFIFSVFDQETQVAVFATGDTLSMLCKFNVTSMTQIGACVTNAAGTIASALPAPIDGNMIFAGGAPTWIAKFSLATLALVGSSVSLGLIGSITSLASAAAPDVAYAATANRLFKFNVSNMTTIASSNPFSNHAPQSASIDPVSMIGYYGCNGGFACVIDLTSMAPIGTCGVAPTAPTSLPSVVSPTPNITYFGTNNGRICLFNLTSASWNITCVQVSLSFGRIVTAQLGRSALSR